MLDREVVFKDLIGDKEFAEIEKNAKDNINHPVFYLLYDQDYAVSSYNYRLAIRENTKNAISLLYTKRQEWLKKRIKRLMEKDRSNVSAVLGEIRCYGYLVDVFGSDLVKDIPEKRNQSTPDFVLSIDNQNISVECASVQINQKVYNELYIFGRDKHLGEFVLAPFGKKNNSSLYQSVILKLMSVKEKNSQLTKSQPSVLWIDLQDEYICKLGTRIDVNGPFFSNIISCGVVGVFSNELWYSCYAHENDSVYEGETLNPELGRATDTGKMRYSGRFYDSDNNHISAVVFSGPNSVCVYENPMAIHKIPDSFMRKMSSGKGFKIEASRTHLLCGDLETTLNNDRRILNHYSDMEWYSVI